MTSRPGFFLVVEGPEGSGKTTLGAGLAARMRNVGIEPVMVREPGGTPAAEHIRQAFLDPASRFDPMSELLFVVAARASLVRDVIEPALDSGRIVVSDRYDLSTVAYQQAGRGVERETVELVNGCATRGLRPDLTLVLDLSVEAGRARQDAAGKARDRMERESTAFHERVTRAYHEAQGAGIVHLDASRPADAVLDLAWRALVDAAPHTFGATHG